MPRDNAILRSLPPSIVPPRDRGRLLFPEDVVAPHSRIRIGTSSAWFERDIDAWLETLRPGTR